MGDDVVDVVDFVDFVNFVDVGDVGDVEVLLGFSDPPPPPQAVRATTAVMMEALAQLLQNDMQFHWSLAHGVELLAK